MNNAVRFSYQRRTTGEIVVTLSLQEVVMANAHKDEVLRLCRVDRRARIVEDVIRDDQEEIK